MYSRLLSQCGLQNPTRLTSHVAMRMPLRSRRLNCLPATSSSQSQDESVKESTSQDSVPGTRPADASTKIDVDKEVSKFARNAATTFAPRPSGATKNPAYKGSLLYTIFDVQAWLALVVGGLLSFNIIFPSDQPDIARLLGMWSIWMFTVPSLRARECTAPEKDALNLLFLAIPVLNVTLPFVWKSFAFIWSADVALLAAVLYWKLSSPAESDAS